MRDTAERRLDLINYISDVREATLLQLSEHFKVSTRTIQRDLNAMSEITCIEVSQGHNGGVKAVSGWYSSRRYLTTEQEDLLHRIAPSLKKDDQKNIQDILLAFGRPRIQTCNKS